MSSDHDQGRPTVSTEIVFCPFGEPPVRVPVEEELLAIEDFFRRPANCPSAAGWNVIGP